MYLNSWSFPLLLHGTVTILSAKREITLVKKHIIIIIKSIAKGLLKILN